MCCDAARVLCCDVQSEEQQDAERLRQNAQTRKEHEERRQVEKAILDITEKHAQVRQKWDARGMVVLCTLSAPLPSRAASLWWRS